MKKQLNNEFLFEITQRMIKNRNVFGAVMCVENGNSSLSWTGGAGEIIADDRYFVASVTKLYVTAVMLILRSEKKLDFIDNIINFFPEGKLNGIHIYKGVEYTNNITIAHLMSNTSGLPDYFYYSKKSGEAVKGLMSEDEAWDLDKVINSVKGLKPKFRPGQKGKVYYSDTNYALLGAIIEKVTGKWIGDVFKELIFNPLKLVNTYAFEDNNDNTPVSMYYGKKKINAPKYMASVTAEGGIVSTAREVMIFLKAFFNGVFFPKEMLNELQQEWKIILFPGQFYFGLGLEKLWTPRIITSFKSIGDILGFWGQTGAYAFYNPKTNLYFTGTINQANGFGHSAALKGIIGIIKTQV